MSLSRLNQHQNILLFTDLEPDDYVSLLIFAQQISAEARHSPKTVAFVVGEGNAALKVARLQKMLEALRKLGLLQNVTTQIIQGANDVLGAQKSFKAEGQEWLSEKEIAAIKKQTPNDQALFNAMDDIADFLREKSNVLVISIKPMRELQMLAHANPDLFSSHTLVATGSYNFRGVWQYQPAIPGSEEDKQNQALLKQRQNKTLQMLNAFSQSYLYETFSTVETNSTSGITAPEFFNLIETATPKSMLGRLRTLINDFKNSLLQSDREYSLPKYKEVLKDKLSAEEIASFDALLGDYNPEQGERLAAIVKAGLEKDKTDQNFQKMQRLIGKWKNITGVRYQIVNADPGLMVALTGACDGLMTAQPVSIGFAGEFTKFEPANDQVKLHMYLPGTLTAEDYLLLRQQERDEKKKPQVLVDAQNPLLARVNDVITQAGRNIHDLTMKQLQQLLETKMIFRTKNGIFATNEVFAKAGLAVALNVDSLNLKISKIRKKNPNIKLSDQAIKDLFKSVPVVLAQLDGAGKARILNAGVLVKMAIENQAPAFLMTKDGDNLQLGFGKVELQDLNVALKAMQEKYNEELNSILTTIASACNDVDAFVNAIKSNEVVAHFTGLQAQLEQSNNLVTEADAANNLSALKSSFGRPDLNKNAHLALQNGGMREMREELAPKVSGQDVPCAIEYASNRQDISVSTREVLVAQGVMTAEQAQKVSAKEFNDDIESVAFIGSISMTAAQRDGFSCDKDAVVVTIDASKPVNIEVTDLAKGFVATQIPGQATIGGGANQLLMADECKKLGCQFTASVKAPVAPAPIAASAAVSSPSIAAVLGASMAKGVTQQPKTQAEAVARDVDHVVVTTPNVKI